MSYGSTFVQFDPNGKISSRLSRSHFRRGDSERSTKLLHYEKDFDVSLSRVADVPAPDRSAVRDSMVAYSNKMKSLQDARRTTGNTQSDPLFVRAKHIPKHPVRPPKKRRPMSFDELLGRDRDSNRDRGDRTRQRPQSDKQKPTRDIKGEELHLPALSERLRDAGPNVQVSLVSASDLYELVDLSLRSKTSRAENIQLKKMEAAERHSPQRRSNRFTSETGSPNEYEKFQRTRESSKTIRAYMNETPSDNLVPSPRYYQQAFSLEPTGITNAPNDSVKSVSKVTKESNEILKRRPNRVKRMKLQDPDLEDIPEDATVASGEISHRSQIEITRRVISPPPQRRSPRALEPLDAILEHSERSSNNATSVIEQRGNVNNRDAKPQRTIEMSPYRSVLPGIDGDKTTKKMLIRDDGDVRIEVTQCPPKQEVVGLPVNAKLRAQKRFKKLIFLRDAPR